MPTMDLQDWISEFTRTDCLWFIKRLSPNDTGLTGSHQSGTFIPRGVLFTAFPTLQSSPADVRDVGIDFYTDSHALHHRSRAVWYSSKSEGRITRVGKSSESPLRSIENTGEIAIFVFVLCEGRDCEEVHAWICGGGGLEADRIEETFGPIEPKSFVSWIPGKTGLNGDLFQPFRDCALVRNEIPPKWLQTFPSGEEIIRKALELRPSDYKSVDDRLEARRACEFEIFKSVEREFWTPRISAVTELDSFIGLAQTILQSRKTRAGNSLELHARQILIEEHFKPDVDFKHRPLTENGKRPDFIFPSQAAYDDPSFPTGKLRMLAAKTTCKDRWRQVLEEADRIKHKHLLTLQEGVSETQFRQMVEGGVKLVVPRKLHDKYPASIRPELQSLEGFIAEVRLAQCN